MGKLIPKLTKEDEARILEKLRASNENVKKMLSSESRDVNPPGPSKFVDFPIGIGPGGEPYPADTIIPYSKQAYALGYHTNPDGTPFPPTVHGHARPNKPATPPQTETDE